MEKNKNTKTINLHWSKVDSFMEDIPVFKFNNFKDLSDSFKPYVECELSERVYVVSYDLSKDRVNDLHQEVFISSNPFSIKAYLENINVIIGNVFLSDVFIFEYATYEDAYKGALDIKATMCNIAYND